MEPHSCNAIKHLPPLPHPIQGRIPSSCMQPSFSLNITSSVFPLVFNHQTNMEKWHLNDLIQQYQLGEPHLTHQSRTSSSSSSLRSLSIESPEYPSLLHNTVNSSPSHLPHPVQDPPTHQLIIQAHNQLRSFEELAMTRAMIAVMSSPSSSSSSYHSQIPTCLRQPDTRRTAFKAYGSAPGPLFRRSNGSCSQAKMKRLFSFLRIVGTQMRDQFRPSGNQLHHMISERKRREKLNESFRALKGLLPPGLKTDKASLLSNAREYLGVLKARVLDLQKKNQALETSLLPEKEDSKDVGGGYGGGEKTAVEVVGVSESSSGERRIELRVTARVEECDLIGLLIGLLEYLRQMQDLSLEFINADTQLHQMSPVNRAILNLKIKRREWDQESFKEAVRRAVCDMAQGRTSFS